MSVIDVNSITKDYGDHKGVFNVDFHVEKGEVLGFLGPNGAGKTTTIRQLLGFIKADQGSVKMNGLDCFTQVEKVQEQVGYLPGEIAFMDEMSGIEFIKFIAHMKNMKDFTKAEQLIDFLALDARGKIKKMSKGMKQKIAIVIAFMNDPEILILDEPTSGLDPLMQNKFVQLIKEEKAKGKTILMSSHIFEEVEDTCDRVAIIKEGEIVAVEEMAKLRSSRRKIYEITFHNQKEAQMFMQDKKDAQLNDHRVIVSVVGNSDGFIKELAKYTIDDINIRTQTLEELFLHFYGGKQS
ncbi:MAG: ABC transporter ATP-binding protein [Erysipelotrichia bacterium]|nr:ABC transporter ATP-binding protein [Erysipelotrichia bacterium]NCC54617.1 ABC transporter ATP-binding protein [Erysipelotrichia bacterium]